MNTIHFLPGKNMLYSESLTRSLFLYATCAYSYIWKALLELLKRELLIISIIIGVGLKIAKDFDSL